MRQARSGFLCVLLALSVLAILLLLAPSWAAALGLDLWDLPATMGEMARQEEQGERLEAQTREASLRVAAKEEVTGQAAEGKLTLAEAVVRFRQLDADAPESQLRAWREHTEGNSDEERYHLTVLRFLEGFRTLPAGSEPLSPAYGAGMPATPE
jgi:hypothetical protein